MTGPTLSDVASTAGARYATADRVVNIRGNVAQKSIDKLRDANSLRDQTRTLLGKTPPHDRFFQRHFAAGLCAG